MKPESINKILGDYSGLSRDNMDFTFRIIEENGKLEYETRGKKYSMYAISKTEFVIPEQNWILEVLNDNSSIDSIKFRLEYGRGITKKKK